MVQPYGSTDVAIACKNSPGLSDKQKIECIPQENYQNLLPKNNKNKKVNWKINKWFFISTVFSLFQISDTLLCLQMVIHETMNK